jgi:hypothetical protein
MGAVKKGLVTNYEKADKFNLDFKGSEYQIPLKTLCPNYSDRIKISAQ